MVSPINSNQNNMNPSEIGVSQPHIFLQNQRIRAIAFRVLHAITVPMTFVFHALKKRVIWLLDTVFFYLNLKPPSFQGNGSTSVSISLVNLEKKAETDLNHVNAPSFQGNSSTSVNKIPSKVLEKGEFQGIEIMLVEGDILLQKTEAIVNAAKPSLLGGGGIDKIIHNAARGSLEKDPLVEECKKKWPNGILSGEAVITKAYEITKKNPSIQWVLHTPGPNCSIKDQNANRSKILMNAYANCLEIARKHGVKSIAFPAISCGIYGYPSQEGQKIAFTTVINKLKEYHPRFLFSKIIFVYYPSRQNQSLIKAAKDQWKSCIQPHLA